MLNAKPPPWLTALAAQPPAMIYGDAKYAVLLDEAVLTLDKNGVATRRTRYALRILTADGRDAAYARVPYEASSDKVRSFAAWLIPKAGKSIDYGKREMVDVASYSNARELYGESREKRISAYRDATPGAVFGFESLTVEDAILGQEIWSFQQRVPVELSSITLHLPADWTAEGRTFNHVPIAPANVDLGLRWELRNLAAIPDEPLSPPAHARVPWLAIDLRPPAGSKTVQTLSFPSWSELSAHFTPAYDSATAVDASLSSRASAVTAQAQNFAARVAALCRFAQAVNYVSITLNTKEAGGMRPRAATRVLHCNYGDCKDKTTLLRSLLRAQGIESYPLIVYSGDSTQVRPEWVSPLQFNHCIVAIAVDNSVTGPAVITHPKFGRLLIFDPTNEYTPPGWLPPEDAGGRGLILAGERGELIQLPSLQPSDSRFERLVTVKMDDLGAVSGTITENFYGTSASQLREQSQSVSESDFRTTIIEPWLWNTLPGARATRVLAKDDFTAATFHLDVDFHAAAYGKLMRNSLLVFKPTLVARRNNIVLKKGTRTQPVVTVPAVFTERTEIEIPQGFVVDEGFAPCEVTAPFGRYTAHAEVRGNKILFQRALEVRSMTLAPEEYETARTFYQKVLDAEQSPIVLSRRP